MFDSSCLVNNIRPCCRALWSRSSLHTNATNCTHAAISPPHLAECNPKIMNPQRTSRRLMENQASSPHPTITSWAVLAERYESYCVCLSISASARDNCYLRMIPTLIDSPNTATACTQTLQIVVPRSGSWRHRPDSARGLPVVYTKDNLRLE